MDDSNDFLTTFRQEAEELLVAVEESILDLEDNPEDGDAINRLFRAAHTIKGSGSMCGFAELAAFTHHLESVLDRVRSNELQIDHKLIDLVLTSRDLIKSMLANDPEDKCTDPERLSETILELERLCSETPVAEAHAPPPAEVGLRTVSIYFKPNKETFQSGMDPGYVLQELRDLGDCRIVCDTSDLPPLEQLDPLECWLAWRITLDTSVDAQKIRDVFLFVEDSSEIRIHESPETILVTEDEPIPRIGELLVSRGAIDQDALDQVLAGHQRLGEELVAQGQIAKSTVDIALADQVVIAKKRAAADSESIRVPSNKLDKLINLIGELVITRAQLSQVAGNLENFDLNVPVEEIERLVAELRDLVLSVRMMPIGSTFNRFRRLVRDLSSELGKEIELVTEGGDTELDKGVIDRLADPLVHLIRNCVDHGIENPSDRRTVGKSPKGQIRLTAEHRGTNVVISVQDDGYGLDTEAIRKKALDHGLIGPETQLTPKETYALVMRAGFSTAKQVTNLSGRGVGMDVVKREIDALRGSIEIDSHRNEGTNIVLSLPLTLAIIEGLLIQVGQGQFVIPLSVIEECLELSADSFVLGSRCDVIQVRGEPLPCVYLRDFFKIDAPKPVIEEAVVVSMCGNRFVIVVDHVIGDHQTVIKSLGKAYQDVVGVSGATILGNGTVALILDVDMIVSTAEREEKLVLRGAA